MSIVRIIRLCLLTLIVVCGIFLLSAQSPVSREYQVKAGFLFNFTQFVEWPASSFSSEQAPIIIGVLGENPFGSYLEEIVSDEKVNGHPLAVQYYKSMDELKTCHVLFINPSEKNNMEQILLNVKEKNILTVSDSSIPFLKQGGIIRLFTESNKMKLQINLEASKTSHLIISSKLLKLAEIFNANKSN